MTDFVYSTATSLDGFIADGENSLAWLFAVDEADPAPMADFMRGVGVQVMGSTTYEWLVAQEDLIEEPEKWSTFFGAMATRILSSRDLPLPQGADARILRGPVGDHIDHRVEVSVAPVLLRDGAPLLPRPVLSDRLHLLSVERNGSFARLVYAVTR